jgi:hypothetical protein
MARGKRLDEAFEIICEYARDNNGCTPSSPELGRLMGISQQNAYNLINRLDNKRLIQWITRNTYKVVPSIWILRDDNISDV